MSVHVLLSQSLATLWLVQFKRAGRQVDQQVGLLGNQLANRIKPWLNCIVVGRVGSTPPCVLADVNTKASPVEWNGRHAVSRSKIPLLVEHVVIGQQELVDRLLDAAIVEQTRPIGDTTTGHSTTRGVSDEQAKRLGQF